jgi:A/G-specific adenine glycosylase
VLARLGLVVERQQPLAPVRHAFTHFRLTLEPVFCLVQPQPGVGEPGLTWLSLGAAATAGVPAPIRKLIERMASNTG